MLRTALLQVCLLLVVSLPWPRLLLVEGRGFLAEPPARASMWRFGFDTPFNYDDNGLNCGGRVMQWTNNQGKCGVCGDPYGGPRLNERGGKYSTGLVARTYTEGQVISVRVYVTANEKGWFEFNLCTQSDPAIPATEDCMEKNLLQLAGGGTRYNLPATVNGAATIDVKLPDGVTCSNCVFRWKWNAGNTWGMSSQGKSCLGCGPQEQFYGCADVAIVAATSTNGGGGSSGSSGNAGSKTNSPTMPSSPPSTSSSSTTTPTTTTTTTTMTTPKPVTKPKPTQTTTKMMTTTTMKLKTKSTTAATAVPPSSTTTSTNSDGQSTGSSQTTPGTQKICQGRNGQGELDEWCQVNCVVLNICPTAFCFCNQ